MISFSCCHCLKTLSVWKKVCFHAKVVRIESFLEPVLSKLVDVIEKSTFGDLRGDLLVPGIDGCTIIIDVKSSDVCNEVNLKLANSNLSDPLSEAENRKLLVLCI
ncbi:hypothetical protein RCL1_007630 [Eukaryota sp. TZLM3-RCL]